MTSLESYVTCAACTDRRHILHGAPDEAVAVSTLLQAQLREPRKL